MGKDIKKNEIAKNVLRALDDLTNTEKVDSLIQNNIIPFKINNEEYRLRQPKQDEADEVATKRRKKYMELVKDDSYYFKKQWIDIYKKKGIDIVKMERDMKVLESQIRDLLLRLAQSTDKKDIDNLKKEIEKTKEELYDISIEKTDLLGYSIEDQINIFATSYICYLVLEKKENGKWKKVFATYEDFKKTNNLVTAKAIYYINYLIYGVNDAG